MHRWLKSGLMIALLLGTAVYALAEDITLTTYYPSPRGVYQELTTTSNTLLATQGGSVGIGMTTAPTDKLDVNGTVNATQVHQGGAPIIPSGAVMFFNLDPPCPTGWSPIVNAEGRYLVGLPAGGTRGLPVGTALSDGENRPAGSHTHPLNPPILNAQRQINWYGATGGGYPNYTDLQAGGMEPHWWGDTLAGGIVVDDPVGSVAGTPAPYLQLLVCKKD